MPSDEWEKNISVLEYSNFWNLLYGNWVQKIKDKRLIPTLLLSGLSS